MIPAMIVYPDIDPVIFSIGAIKIRWYGLMYVAGFLVAWWLARKRAQAPHSPIKTVQQADDLIFYAMLGVILGYAELMKASVADDDPIQPSACAALRRA